jgi:phosphoglycolate phosphatase
MFPVNAIAFDLDGTLVDSSHDLTTAINLTRGQENLPPLPRREVLLMVGDGARKLLERSLAVDAPHLDPDALLPDFLTHYARVCVEQTRPYHGIPEVLQEVGSHFPLAVLTNKPEAMSRTILEELGLTHHFQALVGGDTLPTRKPDTAGLQHLAQTLQIPLQSWLMVGDSRIDEATAHSAGAHFAFCQWGYEPEDRARLVEADIQAGTPEALRDAILSPP